MEDGDALSSCSQDPDGFWRHSGRGFLRLTALHGTRAALGWVELNQRRRVADVIQGDDTFAKGLFRTGNNNAASAAFVARAFGLPCERPTAVLTAYAGMLASHIGSVPFDEFACQLVISPVGAASVSVSFELDELHAEDTTISVWDEATYSGAPDRLVANALRRGAGGAGLACRSVSVQAS